MPVSGIPIPLPVTINGSLPAGTNNIGSVGTQAAGTVLTPVSSDWATGTDWTSASSTPLPANIKAIWVEVALGQSCSIKLDGGGATGFVFSTVQPGWFQVPPGINVSKIYTVAHGSTGAVIAGVLS